MADDITKQPERGAGKRVVVIYETPSVRERAVHFCEQLAAEQDLAGNELEWWSFPLLSHGKKLPDTAEKAAVADVVVFAMKSRGDLPEVIKLWIERWLNKRGEREGALVGLLQDEEGGYEMMPFREIYLRHVARRAGMDYLSHASPAGMKAIPDSLDSFNERAGKVSSLLDGILQKHPESAPNDEGNQFPRKALHR